MALDQTDHLQAAKARVQREIQSKRQEIAELEQQLRTLSEASLIISGKAVEPIGEPGDEKPRRGEITEGIRAFLSEYGGGDFRTGDVVAFLHDKQLTSRPKRELYTPVSSVLKRIKEKEPALPWVLRK